MLTNQDSRGMAGLNRGIPPIVKVSDGTKFQIHEELTE